MCINAHFYYNNKNKRIYLMTTITWDMPLITPTTAGNISEFSDAINDLNDKLLSVGLINYSGENEASLSGIMNFTWPTITTAIYQEFFLCRLKYKLPVGNGVSLYEDIAGSDYKKITHESYDSTQCDVEFEFGFTYNLNNATTTYYNNRRYLILYCNVKFINDNKMVSAENKYMGTGSASSTSTPMYLNNIDHSTKCIVSLTGNSFHLFWYNRNFTTYNTNDNNTRSPNYVYAPLLFFTFIREDNKFYLFTKKNIQTALLNNTTSNTQNNIYPLELQELHLDGSATIIRNPIEFCKKIDNTMPPIGIDNTKSSVATYYNLSDAYKFNPYIARAYVGANYPTMEQIDYYEIDTIHKGTKTRLKYYNSGRLNYKIRSSPLLTENANTLQCTFLMFIGDHPCTTNHL